MSSCISLPPPSWLISPLNCVIFCFNSLILLLTSAVSLSVVPVLPSSISLVSSSSFNVAFSTDNSAIIPPNSFNFSKSNVVVSFNNFWISVKSELSWFIFKLWILLVICSTLTPDGIASPAVLGKSTCNISCWPKSRTSSLMKYLNEIFVSDTNLVLNICSIPGKFFSYDAGPAIKTDILWDVKYLLAHWLTVSVLRLSPYNNLTTCLIGTRYALFNKTSLPLWDAIVNGFS